MLLEFSRVIRLSSFLSGETGGARYLCTLYIGDIYFELLETIEQLFYIILIVERKANNELVED